MASKKMKLRQLRLLMEENNAKSPDIWSVNVTVLTRLEAYEIADIFIDVNKDQVPLPDWITLLEKWQRTIRELPVELYFVFKHKRTLLQFVRQVRKRYPEIKMTI